MRRCHIPCDEPSPSHDSGELDVLRGLLARLTRFSWHEPSVLVMPTLPAGLRAPTNAGGGHPVGASSTSSRSVMPPELLADCMSAWIHCMLRCGGSNSSKVNRRGIDGCSQMVLRPSPSPSGCRHDRVNDSLRRSLVATTTFRCARARSSIWIGSKPPTRRSEVCPSRTDPFLK